MVWSIGDITMHQVRVMSLANGKSLTFNCRALTDQQDVNLRVYVTGDGPDVYEDSFLATATSPNGSFKPTVILISTRLGIDKITQVYWEALIAALHMPQSIGIAGYELSQQRIKHATKR